MDRKALHARIKELEADLKAHTEAVAHKDRIAQFRLKLRSITHFVSHGKLEDAEFTSVRHATVSTRYARRNMATTTRRQASAHGEAEKARPYDANMITCRLRGDTPHLFAHREYRDEPRDQIVVSLLARRHAPTLLCLQVSNRV